MESISKFMAIKARHLKIPWPGAHTNEKHFILDKYKTSKTYTKRSNEDRATVINIQVNDMWSFSIDDWAKIG
jgi:hypothetical protein